MVWPSLRILPTLTGKPPKLTATPPQSHRPDKKACYEEYAQYYECLADSLKFGFERDVLETVVYAGTIEGKAKGPMHAVRPSPSRLT